MAGFPFNCTPKGAIVSFNLNTVKNAVMTTAVVLLTVYVVRRTDFGKRLVAQALTQ